MTSKILAPLEKLLVVALMLGFTLPLALGAYLRLSGSRTPLTAWFRNSTLDGIQLTPKPTALNLGEIRSGRFQTAYAEYYNTSFPARELLIRLANQALYTFFRASSAGIQIGPHHSLVETAYVQEYYLLRDHGDTLRPIVENMRRLQDYCDAHGAPFLMLITPSKAAIYPENNPKGWRARYQPGPRHYEQFMALLREKGVHFIDGHRITADLKTAARGSDSLVYPLGSVHWSDPPALATANAMLAFLAGRGVKVTPITDYETENLYRTNGSEADLAGLLNLAAAPRVLAPIVTVTPSQDEDTDRPNIVFVGGSFLWKIMLLLQKARVFSEIHDYSYYRLAKHVLSDNGRLDLEEGAPPKNFATDIFGSDAIVLECNEERLTRPNHLAAFLQDALAALPAIPAGGRKPPFRYEGRMTHRWDKTVVLQTPAAAEAGPLPPMSGFTAPGGLGAYTVGPSATMHLGPLPPPAEDLVLEVTAGSPVVTPAVTKQEVEVLANGHPVGSMAWDGAALPARQALSIPKECLDADGGGIALEFRVAHPFSPLELGRGVDGRKMGVCVSALRVYTARQGSPALAQPLYRWGEEASLVVDKRREGVPAVRGFTTPGNLGAHTQGRVSTVRFAVAAPPPGAVELVADTSGAILGRGQPSLKAAVYVNRHLVGEWTWNENAAAQRKVMIPPGVITDGEVRVELRFGPVLSLREMSGSPETRKLGVCFTAFRLKVVER